MVLTYLPAALAGAYYLASSATGYEKATSFALTAHFTKRVLEVCKTPSFFFLYILCRFHTRTERSFDS